MKKYIYILLFVLFFIPFSVKADVPEIESKNAILLNLTNNEVLYEKGKDEVIKVASLQKIMTALVAIEKIDNLDETYTIAPGMFNSLDSDLLVVGLKAYDTVTYNDLLYCTLLKSGADCAYSLAMAVSNSEEEYVKLMNNKAKELGLKNTVFKNSTGLDLEGQQSTVNEISILFKYALNNKDFKRIVTTPEYTIGGKYQFEGPRKKASSFGADYIQGGKTGFTEGAGLCLASYASYENVDYIFVTAGADYNKKNQNFLDHKTMYDYYTTNYSLKTILKKKDVIAEIKTIYNEPVTIKASRDVVLYINNSIFNNDLKIEYDGNKVLKRNIKKGDKIGKYTIKYKDIVLYEEDVLSPVSVNFKLSKTLIIILFVIVSSMIIHLLLRPIRRKIKKRRKRKKD